ncbi:uncharacterized protein LOC121918687, partial [Sceloporus undulatus]|uniref:uncharacterized protein LOC121918687 n=1 Tax=Sceloporus undulatus TaxID=8520 RepID=UPI001C4AA68A
MELTPRGVPDDRARVRPPDVGPLRLPGQRQDSEVLFEVSDTGRGGLRRPQLPLADRSTLRIPADLAADALSGQGAEGQGGGHPGGSSMAPTSLVFGDPQSGYSKFSSASQAGPAVPGSRSPPRSFLASASRLEIERFTLTGYGYSPEVIESILASRRPSTIKIYEYTFKAFKRWCKRKKKDFFRITVPTLLQFLQDGVDQGLRPNTVKRQISAVTSILPHDEAALISQHPHIRRLLKGVSNRSPPTIHRFPSWDLHKVLKALTIAPFEPLREASLKFLTFKTLFLTAITSARRVSELGALSVRKELCIFRPDSVILRPDPTFIPKVNSVFHSSQDIILPSFCPRPSEELEKVWHTLDVRRSIRIYLKRTASFRKSETLFVSFHPRSQGKKVSLSTLSRWIRECISTCYKALDLVPPQGITAHSTRSAATSAALTTNAPPGRDLQSGH